MEPSITTDRYIVYADGQLCSTFPGQEEEFTVRKYKENLGKPYNRITLYVVTNQTICIQKTMGVMMISMIGLIEHFSYKFVKLACSTVVFTFKKIPGFDPQCVVEVRGGAAYARCC